MSLSPQQIEDITKRVTRNMLEQGGTPEQAKEAAKRAIAQASNVRVNNDPPAWDYEPERGFLGNFATNTQTPPRESDPYSFLDYEKEKGLGFKGRLYEGFARRDNPEEMRRALSLSQIIRKFLFWASSRSKVMSL